MKVLTAIVVIALGLLVPSSVLAQQDLRNPDQVAPAVEVSQDLRNPDQVAPAHDIRQDLRNPDQVSPTALLVPDAEPAVAATDTSSESTTGGGLGTLWIVLLSAGCAAALACAGYATVRFAHAHGYGRPAI